jgi:hypothetical protein
MRNQQSAAAAVFKEVADRVQKLETKCEELMQLVKDHIAPSVLYGSNFGLSAYRNDDGYNLTTPNLSFPSPGKSRFVPSQATLQYVLSVLPSGTFSSDSLQEIRGFACPSTFQSSQHPPKANSPETHPENPIAHTRVKKKGAEDPVGRPIQGKRKKK